MASAPNNLPLFYNDLMPLNVRDHGNWSFRTGTSLPFASGQHAIPVTVDEFALVQRHAPIIFSAGDRPVPLALFGLNEGVNVFIDSDGLLASEVYIPAYIRRYPFMLARLEANSDTMTLCFDPTSGSMGEFKDGEKLFDGEQATQFTQDILKFCEGFEEAGHRTQAFMDELQKHDLLMDGEVSISQDGLEQPFVYRGFRMINQEKLREVRGDQLRTWNQSGMLPLIFGHVYSLDMMRVIFARQTAQGKGPGAELAAANAAPAVPAAAPAKKTKK